MKIICSILFYFLFSISVSAQKIHFTDTTNIWNIIFVFTGDPIPEYSFTVDAYEGDTTIGTNTYKYFSGIGWVREDTLNNKVYLLDILTDSEIVFMDYNLIVGDTVRHNGFTHVVGSIDSTLINGLWYKAWHFFPISSAWGYDIVEGIGCIENPYFILNPVEPEASWGVYCFRNKGTVPPLSPPVEGFDNVTSCSLPTTLFSKNITIPSNSVSIFPNPANEELTIKTNNILPYTITVQNMIGQIVQTIETNNQQETINTSNIIAGIYNICISNENGKRINNKVVIAH